MLKNLTEDQGRNALMASIGGTTTKAGASASVLGWRFWLAKYTCDHLLDVFDPSGDHC